MLLKIVSKDFDLPDSVDEDRIRELLIPAFEYLIENDFSKLVQLLYRADVDQEELKKKLEGTEGQSTAAIITDAYLSRQRAKIDTWKKYSAGTAEQT